MTKRVHIGNLNRRIVIQNNVLVASATGQKTKTPQTYATCWAELDDVSGNESEDGKIVALSVRKYTIRYDAGILTGGTEMIIVDEDGSYNINSIEQVGRKTYLTLKCSKKE